ncbi:unnamed protein product [Adineta steineri]|uniref:Uncharacterized protein n=1 Tax=Adineta steineri TaxID=433720 RepID=A0A819EP69_9BILA|nr:unnamed protein product [Adineta steineri]
MQDNKHSHNEKSSNHYPLEYLDQFLQLICAPDLITMGLFPNAKEITESFAVWTALRRYILPKLSLSSSSSTTTCTTDNRQNAIIVVGDGMTPRTAALCAYLTKGQWQCYSIDPLLQYDTYADITFINRRSLTTIDQCKEWKNIKGLRMTRAKIQTVSIQCRKAIIVMMHAHVTIEDAINAVDASEGIYGVVTCPCCKWAPYQEECFQQAPHEQYIDKRLLSAKNQINVWCFPQGYHYKSSIDTKQISNEHNVWGVDANMIEHILSTRDGVKQRAIDLWPQIFYNGIKAFNPTDKNSLLDDVNAWPWGLTTWSPKDISPLVKSCNDKSDISSSTDVSILPSWFKKPVLIIGTIGAIRRCKHTVFYELNTCSIPPTEELEDILRITSYTSSIKNTSEEKTFPTLDGTFPSLLKSADRIWTCVEYQRHCQAISAFDCKVDRKIKKQHLPTENINTTVESLKINRVNILLSLLSYKQITYPAAQLNDHKKMKILQQNPQPRETLFPWAMSLRTGDILVAYCQFGYNTSYESVLYLIDGILLFDTKLQMFGIERRILR